MYNAGSNPVVLEVGQPLFPIWFCKLASDDAEPYGGRHKGQSTISAEDVQRMQGRVASPEALALDVQKLYQRLRYVMIIGGVFILSVVLPIISSIVVEVIKPKLIGNPSGHDQKHELATDATRAQVTQPITPPVSSPPPLASTLPVPAAVKPDPPPLAVPAAPPAPGTPKPPLP